MLTVTPTKAYLRDVRRIGSKDRQAATNAALVLFSKNHRDSKLNFEKVLSRRGYFTIRATLGDRILLKELHPGSYAAVAVGDHDYIYKAYFKKQSK